VIEAWPTPDVGLPSNERGGHVLVVDVDGSLVASDLLWEGVLRLTAERTRLLPGAVRALLRGRAALKTYVARHAPLDVATLPLSSAVLALMENARARGDRVCLVSGAAHVDVRALGERLPVDGAYGTMDEAISRSVTIGDAPYLFA
jgi:phosphoserine phosphatase